MIIKALVNIVFLLSSPLWILPILVYWYFTDKRIKRAIIDTVTGKEWFWEDLD